MVLYPSYFSDVITLSFAYSAQTIIWEGHGNYVKQTYRNRCYIAGANGRLALNVPVVHTGKGFSIPYKEVQIDYSEPWADNHLKSIHSAYNSSPFYQYYQDDLEKLFSEIPELLYHWNLKTFDFLIRNMSLELNFEETTAFKNDALANNLIKAKGKPLYSVDHYIQVFREKYGFLQPLCGLDLLFNLGPSSIAYLKSQNKRLRHS
ncbi:WbqC family protein [Nonlabens spongiae]|uniref:WbqC family protein n=1 Tax=Nonlabens spongiae TaxID=331648 RepID=UPI001FE305EC|nr:WbqC family protein [Nonlabens spongiae]